MPDIMKRSAKDSLSRGQTLNRVGHCLYRSEESRRYYAILKRGGKQIKRSLKTTDPALAKRRLAVLEERASRLNSETNGKILFTDLAKRWLDAVAPAMKISSHDRQVRVVKNLGEVFGKNIVRAISKPVVEAWAYKRSKAVAARTFNYERQTFIRILNYALRDGLILENPAIVVKRLRQQKHEVVIPTKEQFRKFVEAMRTLKVSALEGANLCEFLAYSGCRLSEATHTLWGDVNFEKKTFTVTGGEFGTKNHEARVVPLFPALERFLRILKESLPDIPKPTDRIFTIQGARTSMTNACYNAELPIFTHHHLRHFFCSNAIEAGVDFKAIAGWLGHKDGGLLVAKTYGHLRDEHSAAMAQKMSFMV